MTENNPWARLFDCLQARPRRRLLTGLGSYGPTDTVHFTDVYHGDVSPEAPIRVAFVHIHLPKLAAAGYISWNEQTHEISHGPRFDEIAPLIGLVQTHSDSLPTGWV